MNAFHVLGGVTAIWAVLVAIVGIRKEDFPGGMEKVVGAISAVLVIGTISAALITSANESEDNGGGEATQSESH